MSDVRALLSRREGTHGRFKDTATYAQALKMTMRETPNWKTLHPVQKEALEMAAVKIARILCGDPLHADHWHDGAGYLTLGEGPCNGRSDP